jgi:hypothetical protein
MSPPAGNTSLAALSDKDELGHSASLATFDLDLEKAGANVKTRWGMAWFLARRYPLGGVGLAIVVVFILVALLAPYITYYDPLSTNPSISLSDSPQAISGVGWTSSYSGS